MTRSVVADRLADDAEIGVGHGIDDDVAHAIGRKLVERGAQGGRSPPCTCFSGTSPTLCRVWRASTRTRLESRHRIERVMAHVGVGQQDVAHEQMAEEDGAAVLREGRIVDRLPGVQCVEQRVADRADIAGVGRIEGRAVFEEEALAARRLQRIECRQRLGDGVLGRDRARLQRHDDGVDVVGDRAFAGTPMVWMVRMPFLTSMPAMSVAPVKSSAITPRMAMAGP